jgi:hypothetical protein
MRSRFEKSIGSKRRKDHSKAGKARAMNLFMILGRAKGSGGTGRSKFETGGGRSLRWRDFSPAGRRFSWQVTTK